MPVPFSPTGSGFAMIGAVVGPLMMLAMATSRPGPVRSLLKAQADAPERARRPSSLGVPEPQLEPLIRSGVVVREADGCVWVDRAKASRRAWRIAGVFAVVLALVAGAVLSILAIGG